MSTTIRTGSADPGMPHARGQAPVTMLTPVELCLATTGQRKEHMNARGTTLAALALCSLTLSAPVLAQSGSGSAGQYRLSLGTSVFSYSSSTVEFGGGVEQDSTQTNFGLPADLIDLQVAYGLSSLISLGGSLVLTREATEIEQQGGGESESSELSIILGPILDIYFSRDAFSSGQIVPFASFGAALVVNSQEQNQVETSLTGFSLSGNVGLRWLLAPDLSLDPTFGIRYISTSGERDNGTAEEDIDFSTFSVGLGLYISLWI